MSHIATSFFVHIVSHTNLSEYNTPCLTGGENVHDLLCKQFPLYRLNPYCQQEILWLLNGLVSWPKSKMEVQRNESCMVLLNALDMRPKEQQVATGMANMSKIDVAKELSSGRVSVLYQIIVPLKLREFYRETNGTLLVPQQESKILYTDERLAELARKRKKLDAVKAPRYGTVGTKIFTQGETGLADEPAKLFIEGVLSPSEAVYAAGTLCSLSSPIVALGISWQKYLHPPHTTDVPFQHSPSIPFLVCYFPLSP